MVKNEDSQLSSENGMLIALAVIIVLVIGPFVWKAIQGGYDTILARFTKASSNADIDSWNKNKYKNKRGATLKVVPFLHSIFI